MLSWGWLWAFTLWPLPILARWLLPAVEESPNAIRVPFFQLLQAVQEERRPNRLGSFGLALLYLLAWSALLTALARPVWIGEPIPLPQEGRDLMLAVDISESMLEKDMQVQGGYIDRLSAVKYVVGDFIDARAGDRIGLILFGENTYLQTPLTFDTRTVRVQLEEALPGFAGNRTAIGNAIGLAIKHLRDRPADSRVLLLLTDGANNHGIEPAQMSAVAQEAGIRIHTIGVGAEEKIERSLFGPRRVNPSANLDEATLKRIAEQTGGQYFRARDPQELVRVYDYIDQLEPVPEEQTFRPTRSLYHIPLAAAMGLACLIWLLKALPRLWQSLQTRSGSPTQPGQKGMGSI